MNQSNNYHSYPMTSNHVFPYNGLDTSAVEKMGFQMAPLLLSTYIGAIYTISLKNGINRKC